MTTPVEELVDGGLQQHGDDYNRINLDICVRSHRSRSRAGGDVDAHPGFSFCRDCLAWLRGESDDDPLDNGEEMAKRQTTPNMWTPWAAAMTEMMAERGMSV